MAVFVHFSKKGNAEVRGNSKRQEEKDNKAIRCAVSWDSCFVYFFCACTQITLATPSHMKIHKGERPREKKGRKMFLPVIDIMDA